MHILGRHCQVALPAQKFAHKFDAINAGFPTVAAVYDRRFFLATCHKTGGHRPPLQFNSPGFDAEPLEHPVERAAVDLEQFRGAAHVSIEPVQDVEDVLALDFFERDKFMRE